MNTTYLFVPGNNPGMIQSSMLFGADSVIIDLEDAVSANEKDGARVLLREALLNLDFLNSNIVIRINPYNSEYFEKDIKNISFANPTIKSFSILVPKSEPKSFFEIEKILDEMKISIDTKMIALIETAVGLENISEIIKNSKRIKGILLGAEDLTSDFGIPRTKSSHEILYARNKTVAACKAYNLECIDTPFTDVDDEKGLFEDSLFAKNIGFSGKACINPRQIEIVKKAFLPSKEELEFAKRVIKTNELAKKDNLGVFSIDGKMVDAPIIKRAENTLNLYEELVGEKYD